MRWSDIIASNRRQNKPVRSRRLWQPHIQQVHTFPDAGEDLAQSPAGSAFRAAAAVLRQPVCQRQPWKLVAGECVVLRRDAGRVVEAAHGDIGVAGRRIVDKGELGAAGGAECARRMGAGPEPDWRSRKQFEICRRHAEPRDTGSAGGSPAHVTMTIRRIKDPLRHAVPDRFAITSARQHG